MGVMAKFYKDHTDGTYHLHMREWDPETQQGGNDQHLEFTSDEFAAAYAAMQRHVETQE